MKKRLSKYNNSFLNNKSQWLWICFLTVLLTACGQPSSGNKVNSADSAGASITGDTAKTGISDRAGTAAVSDSTAAGVGTNANIVSTQDSAVEKKKQ